MGSLVRSGLLSRCRSWKFGASPVEIGWKPAAVARPWVPVDRHREVSTCQGTPESLDTAPWAAEIKQPPSPECPIRASVLSIPPLDATWIRIAESAGPLRAFCSPFETPNRPRTRSENGVAREQCSSIVAMLSSYPPPPSARKLSVPLPLPAPPPPPFPQQPP